MSTCVIPRTAQSSQTSRAQSTVRFPRIARFRRPHDPPPDGRGFRIAGADFSASISVFLIALPLSLGIALATGAPLQAGLVAAAVGGLVVGRLGGAPLQVSGPAAGLTVVTADLIQQYGWRTTCAITICAGLAQLVLAALRVARSALAVSPAIVHGMLAGIGVTIALAQLHIVLGGSPQSSAVDNVLGLPAQLANLHPGALSVSVLTIAVLLVWPRIPGRVGRAVRKLPAALAAVAVATTLAALAGISLERVDLPSWRSHALPELPHGPALGLLAAVLTVTLVASVESLLSAVAVDKLVAARKEPAVQIPRARLDRELAGQGAGNVVSGALGGLPITGVAVRSAANVAAGSVSRNSAMLHGLWIAVAALLLVPVLDLIPLAALAALVMFVGIQMVNLTHMRSVSRNRELLVYVATLTAVVFTGVLEGVVIGIAVAVAVSLHRLTRTRITTEERSGVHRVHARGQLTFLAVPRLSRMLHQVPQGADCVVELDGSFMDHAAHEALYDWRAAHIARGGTAEFTGRAGARIAESSSEFHACCRPWTPWRNHHCGRHADGGRAAAGHAVAGRAAMEQTVPVYTGGGPSGAEASGARATGTEHSAVRGSAGAAPGKVLLSGLPSGGTGSSGAWQAGEAPEERTDSGRGDPGGIGRTSSILQLASGLSSFQRNTAPLVREELARLAREGQQPSQLFLTCADSRLVTSMITSSGPGDLFTVRNVGNLVPLPGTDRGDESVAAAIEYAVDVLRVESITICGHSGCGAMQALLDDAPNDTDDEPATPLRRWLRHGLPSLERMKSRRHSWARISGRLPADAVEQLCLTNVVQQLEHLRAHESVARRLADGTLELHGMYFHVGEAQAYLLANGAGSGGVGEMVFNPVAPTALEESRA
ncbi:MULTISPECIES: SulP family inorganic anion transporter [unclassified Streptomyces]|uniref:bifunctional SulP family inorganic anion transporter/carbonic anhydrase n=1 Tax=unclassified Streptomyces TaxID=2593676 RepID=UPI00081EEC5A|nr:MULTISPECIES: SulP family inorganic anion transporter [unclassified Streptomyces]MYZ38310.1 transporter [Streptomyces sp. SID4917]SCF97670.1 carbonic anhydrase [Streptomyces sp. MnatMP-M17]